MVDGSIVKESVKNRLKKFQPSNSEVSAPFDLYLSRLSRALVSNESRSISFFASDLSNSPRANQIVPFLRHLITGTSRDSSGRQSHRILLVIEALLRNPYIKISRIESTILKSVVACFQQQCELDLGGKDLELVVRERAAFVLSLLFQHQNVNNQPINKQLKKLRRKNQLHFALISGMERIVNN